MQFRVSAVAAARAHSCARTDALIDIQWEKLILLCEAAAILPGRPSVTTLWRWRTRGIRGRKLESISIGGRVYTTVEALERFAQHNAIETQVGIRTPAQRARAIRAAERELDA
jgi:hypothetical protein